MMDYHVLPPRRSSSPRRSQEPPQPRLLGGDVTPRRSSSYPVANINIVPNTSSSSSSSSPVVLVDNNSRRSLPPAKRRRVVVVKDSSSHAGPNNSSSSSLPPPRPRPPLVHTSPPPTPLTVTRAAIKATAALPPPKKTTVQRSRTPTPTPTLQDQTPTKSPGVSRLASLPGRLVDSKSSVGGHERQAHMGNSNRHHKVKDTMGDEREHASLESPQSTSSSTGTAAVASKFPSVSGSCASTTTPMIALPPQQPPPPAGVGVVKEPMTQRNRPLPGGGETIAPSPTPNSTASVATTSTTNQNDDIMKSMCHLPCSLPKFRDPQLCMWTTSHSANNPSEDRSSSLVNVLLQPLPPNFDSETQLPPLPTVPSYPTLIRLNLWSVIDGHGGGCVATYASEVLLPHVAASVSRALGCAIVDRGVCLVNGQLRDANALDLDGLIQVTSVPGAGEYSNNPNSIHYRSPYERSDSEEDEEEVGVGDNDNYDNNNNKAPREEHPPSRKTRDSAADSLVVVEEDDDKSVHNTTEASSILPISKRRGESDKSTGLAGGSCRISKSTNTTAATSSSSPSSRSPLVDGSGTTFTTAAVAAVAAAAAEDESLVGAGVDASVSSVKTSVKTAASLTKKPLVGTHSPNEVAAITRAITESFLAVDEGWINSIDPVATHQTSCQANGRWNSGACALVVFTIQRLDWTSVSEPNREKESRGPDDKPQRNTSENRDAARRRMLDNAARTKSASSVMSTVSSTSSLTTEAVHASGLESEITETEEEEDDDYYGMGNRRSDYYGGPNSVHPSLLKKKNDSLISPPGGCSCHCYRAHDAFLYSAHVGDCRAVMLGSAPPRTIKVRGGGTNKSSSGSTSGGHNDLITTDDDESSHHSSDETECLSSSDHDADSSEDDDYTVDDSRRNPPAPTTPATAAGSTLMASNLVTGSAGTRVAPPASAAVDSIQNPVPVGTVPTTAVGTAVTASSVGTTTSSSTTTSSTTSTTATAPAYRIIPRRVARPRGNGTSPRRRESRNSNNNDYSGPFRPLPPLINNSNSHQSSSGLSSAEASSSEAARSSESIDNSTGDGTNGHRDRTTQRSLASRGDDNSTSSSQTRDDQSSSDSNDQLPPFHLPPATRPIDLTTDHSAYNPAEVTAVLRRCNNAPRAISAGVGGGIKRVAGSLAVTRAFGDAYLKTPLLSFNPYKSHAPYITARPEVNCRPLVKDFDKVLILSTDGVWERASGEDVLRWVRNFYEERVAEMERRKNRRGKASSNEDSNNTGQQQESTALKTSTSRNAHEGADRDLFETTASVTTTNTAVNAIGTTRPEEGGDTTMSSSRKREHTASSPGPCNNNNNNYNSTTTTNNNNASNKRRKRNGHMSYNVADVIVRRVLNKVRRARNISSLQALMSLPLGRARRSKHDDITSSVVDLSAFVS